MLLWLFMVTEFVKQLLDIILSGNVHTQVTLLFMQLSLLCMLKCVLWVRYCSLQMFIEQWCAMNE